MIISKTPFRISFFGGGTDYPAWVEKHGGAVLSTSIDKYCYTTCRWLPPFFDHNYRITYSKVEHVCSVDEIQHRAIRAVLRDYAPDRGMEIHCDADLPARSGLGSSSSFVVGLLNAMEGLCGRRLSTRDMATEAIRYEQVVLEETVGYQDQIAAAYGGLNQISFYKDSTFRVEPLLITDERKNDLNSRLMLFFTGFSRIASEVAKDQVANMNQKNRELTEMRAMVDHASEILMGNRSLDEFGELLHLSWQKKRSLSNSITNDNIDKIYNSARHAGAIGGKLLGAGGGGFILFYANPEKQENIRKALQHLIHVPFRFDNEGSRIIYYKPR